MIEENVQSDLGMYLLGQVHLSGPSVPNESSRNYCKVPNVHVKGLVLVGQNGGSTQGLTPDRWWKPPSWSTVGAQGIFGGAMKCVEIEKNTNNESTLVC